MLPDQRAIADELMAEAVDSSTLTSEQIDSAVQQIDDLAGSGVEWVQEWQRSMLRAGVGRELSKFRSRFRKQAQTKKGTDVDVPTSGGIRRAGESGEVENHYIEFSQMTLDEFESWTADRRKQRDTLSRDIQWATDAIEVALEMGCDTMGPAIDELARRHA